MSDLTATELAHALGVSRPRISQYVSEGKLNGCYRGEGRGRRFSLEKVALALDRKLDRGQMMGNGNGTKRRLAEVLEADGQSTGAATDPAEELKSAPGNDDAQRYDRARTYLAEEKARTARRDNMLAEGRYVLASEVERQVTRLISQEVAEFESVLREFARAIADRAGFNFLIARQIGLEIWREHRSGRSAMLSEKSTASELTNVEKSEDV